MVPRSLVKNYPRCFCGGVFFWDEVCISIGGFGIKQVIFQHMGGPHLISWRPQRLISPKREGGPSRWLLVWTATLPRVSLTELSPQTVDSLSLHNHMSQLKEISLCIYMHKHILLVLFTQRTLPNVVVPLTPTALWSLSGMLRWRAEWWDRASSTHLK